MKKTNFPKMLRSAISLLAAVSMLLGTVPMVFAAEADALTVQGSGINRLEGLNVNYKDYLNSQVAFQLPDEIGKEEEISVIIRTDLPSVMDAYDATDKSMSLQEFATTDQAAAITEKIRARQAAILSTLDEQGVEYKVGEEYSALFAGFELLIKGKDYTVTCMSMADGEKVVLGQEYKSQEAELVENNVNVYETGIFNASNVPYDGTGMVVAVLDTGLDSNHTAFSVNNFKSQKLGMTYDDVAQVLSQTKAYEWADGGLSVDDVYINTKVPFGYDYADNDPDVYSTHNNHGTHVSGVIVGKDDTITGVAPNAQLVAMKIFSDVEDSARSAWILAALEDCVILGVDVINMSLGTACGFAHETEEELLDGVYSRIREAGIAVVVAASNSYNSAYSSEANGNLPLTSNPDSGTVGSPGTYKGTLSVASVNGVETPYIKYSGSIIYFDEANDNSGKEKNFFDALLGDKQSQKVEYVTIPGVGRSADYTGLDVKGKIALVRRGSNTFEEKALIAEAQGAIGIIIYNNVSGEIKMNIGDATLAVCSIAQDDGEKLAASPSGTLTIDKSQTSGPFMSDFSSWGPTPSLGIKPEITAHGGNILSSVTGGGYDRLSGTSMACPNMAGAVVLLHQYVVENFPEIAGDVGAVTALVNRLLMSTADIIINTNGEPYAVRKQGAGLANLESATNTPAVVITYDKDGNEMDTTKLELGDDPSKTGVYEMTFAVDNFGKDTLIYDLTTKVITEGVSETKTNAGKTTVTEEAYVLAGAKMEIVSIEGGTNSGNRIKVQGGQQAKVTVRITLSAEDKTYLNNSFENGMYVEGFLTLHATRGTKIDLNVPYLAFYGDWTRAPMFDLEYYDTNADELNDGIDPEDKLMADAFPSRAVGGISGDFVSYLGSYYFIQDPKDMVISASKDYIALSNQTGAVHSLRFVWAGMLRAARTIDITIVNQATGEIVYECVEEDVRKSYGDGGPIRPSNVEIEFDVMEHNLANNTELMVKLVGHMDYNDGIMDTNRSYTMEFPMTIDFEAPTVSDVEYYYEYDKTEKKNRLYAKIAVYDNHFAMCGQLGYVVMGKDDNDNDAPELKAFEQYMNPIYSKKNSTTYVTVELTDYVYQIKDYAYNKNSFVFTAYDYALNYASYEIRLPDTYEDFFMEGMDEGLTLSPNEVYTLEPVVTPDTQWSELLEFTSSKPSVVRVVNNKLVAVASGLATIRVSDPKTGKRVTFQVKVLKKGDDGYRKYDRPVADMFSLTGYITKKAYYILDNEEKDIGDTGDTRFFEGRYNLSLFPSESVLLTYDIDPFFPRDTEIVFESSNEDIVKVGADGTVTAMKEGFASVTVKMLLDGKSTYYSESVSIEVKDPYDVTGGIMNHYYGLGGLVEVPARLKLKEIGSFAFANFEYIDKTPEEIEEDDRETTKQWFIGDGTITKVVLPEGIEKINAYAFANLTALEEIVLPSTLTAIEYGAFYNCTSLKKITFSGENNLQIINQNAFELCNLEGKLELPSACVISDYAFAGNKNLKEVVTGDSLLSISQYAFAGCVKLEKFTVTAKLVKYGAYAFTGCENLKSFYVNAAVLPEGMFYECENLTEVKIGPDVNTIGEFAFRATDVSVFEVVAGNKAYKAGKNPYILSADGKKLVAAAPTLSGEITEEQLGGKKITAIGDGAFSHGSKATSVNLPNVTKVGDYAFGSAKYLTSVTLGELTDIGEYAFFETGITTLPRFTAKTKIGRYAFAFTAITEVTVPDKMEVAEGVFSECAQLTTVVVGNDVVLGKYAFGMDKDSAFKVERKDIDGKRYFYYTFGTALQNVTIGQNVTVGETAFTNAASLQKVTLGAGAKLEKMAFYNNASLVDIDLSGVVSLGDYALSGDVYYMCLDDQMQIAAVDSTGHYMYTYHAPRIPAANLSAAKEIGEYAFAYCREMATVTLGEKIKEIKQYTFAGCEKLTSINTAAVETIGDYAFTECNALPTVDLSAAKTIGQYAFVYNKALTSVTLNEKGSTIGEGAFSYSEKLATVNHMNAVTDIGNYAFAYTALVSADLSGAKKVGDHAFMKENYTSFNVTLGDKIETLGDNPFAMCVMVPFTEKKENKKTGKTEILTSFEISKNVMVDEGSLYCKVPNGWELITYLGEDPMNAKVAEDTVRVSGMAFTGSKVQLVDLPTTVAAIGHKAFYDCDALDMVVFRSYDAPVLEEAYDPTYYETFEHIPGSGDYGTYNDYEGNEVSIIGQGFLPYFMWNATGGMYSNVFYGANFKDYVGYVENKISMIRPTNGQRYDSYIYDQYFDLRLDGAVAPDRNTMAVIKAIKNLPARPTLEHRAQVEAARALYNKIATLEQQALVYNYADLVTAEQRIAAELKEQQGGQTPPPAAPVPAANNGWIWIVVGVALLALVIVALIKIKQGKLTKQSVQNGCKAFGAWCKRTFTGANILAFFKAIPGAVWWFIKSIPGWVWFVIRSIPGWAVAFGLWAWKVIKATPGAIVKAAVWTWNGIRAIGKKLSLWGGAAWASFESRTHATVRDEFIKEPEEEIPEEIPAEDAPAEDAPAEDAPAEDAPAEEIPADSALLADSTPVITEAVPAEESSTEETSVEEAPAAAKKEKKAKKAKKAKSAKQPKESKKRPCRWLKKVLLILAAMAVVVGVVLVLTTVNFGGEPTPYEVNDRENYTVSVQFNANGGEFDTGLEVITDTFNIASMPATDGNVSLALLDPDDTNRAEHFKPVLNGYTLVGWYKNCTVNADGTKTYSEPWNFETDRLTLPVSGSYTATQPQLTLYAAWAPICTVEFYYCDAPDTVAHTLKLEGSIGGQITMPVWSEKTGTITMNSIPKRENYTFTKAYLDAARTQPIEGATYDHPAKLNVADGTITDSVLKVYLDWQEGNWFHIYNAEQFVKNASVKGHYVLMNDLDFADANWPTSLTTGDFAGTIEGNGHTIRNVKVTQTNTSKANVGLFGVLSDTAVIRNLKLENITVTIEKGTRLAGTSYGVLCGTRKDAAKLEGVTITASHLQIDADAYFGTEEYDIGLLCGTGKVDDIGFAGIDCTVVGDNPEKVTVTVSGNTVTLKFAD